MGREIDLLAQYPKSKRDPAQRAAQKTEEDRMIARRFDRDFFDGDRRHGYGGYNYDPRFWQPVIPAFQEYYGLTKDHSVLDVGCGKGFMMYDMSLLIPGISVQGIDISEYAISNAVEAMKPYVQVANATQLPFPDKSFDLVISVTTVHNLEREGCIQALREIMRVSRGHAFITIDGYYTDEERQRLEEWILTARTVLHADGWRALFAEAEYLGDYYWFLP